MNAEQDNNATATMSRPIPAHVLPDRVCDPDIFNLPDAHTDIHKAWSRVRNNNPGLIFANCFNGHWMPTSAEPVARVFREHETFSSLDAISIPPMPGTPRQLPINADPPLHDASGAGIHKCPGANLARHEIIAFVEEWLKRIPEFTITPGETAITLPGQVMGMGHLPLSWRGMPA